MNLPVGLVSNALSHYLQGVSNHHECTGVNTTDQLFKLWQLPETYDCVQDLFIPAGVSSLALNNSKGSLKNNFTFLFSDLGCNSTPETSYEA